MGLSRGVLGRGHIEFVSIPKAMCHYICGIRLCARVSTATTRSNPCNPWWVAESTLSSFIRKLCMPLRVAGTHAFMQFHSLPLYDPRRMTTCFSSQSVSDSNIFLLLWRSVKRLNHIHSILNIIAKINNLDTYFPPTLLLPTPPPLPLLPPSNGPFLSHLLLLLAMEPFRSWVLFPDALR